MENQSCNIDFSYQVIRGNEQMEYHIILSKVFVESIKPKKQIELPALDGIMSAEGNLDDVEATGSDQQIFEKVSSPSSTGSVKKPCEITKIIDFYMSSENSEGEE